MVARMRFESLVIRTTLPTKGSACGEVMVLLSQILAENSKHFSLGRSEALRGEL